MEQGSDLRYLQHTCRTADKYKSYVSQAFVLVPKGATLKLLVFSPMCKKSYQQ